MSLFVCTDALNSQGAGPSRSGPFRRFPRRELAGPSRPALLCTHGRLSWASSGPAAFAFQGSGWALGALGVLHGHVKPLGEELAPRLVAHDCVFKQ